jgi:NAD+ kinase
MIDKKIYFVIDKTIKKKKFKDLIFKKYKNYLPKNSDVIVVIGGDGFMLQTMKKYLHFNKPFFGMNKGSFGFLMNKFNLKKISKRIAKSKQIIITPIQMNSISKNNIRKSAYAINEISLLRQSRQASSLEIKKNNKVLIKKLVGDGVLISTPAGSTAYNLSVYGPILSLNSKKLAVTPISPFRPRRWKGKVVSDKSVIKVRNLNLQKRPVMLVADNVEIRNVRTVSISASKLIKFKLLYDQNNSLTKKIKLEQMKKETN